MPRQWRQFRRQALRFLARSIPNSCLVEVQVYVGVLRQCSAEGTEGGDGAFNRARMYVSSKIAYKSSPGRKVDTLRLGYVAGARGAASNAALVAEVRQRRCPLGPSLEIPVSASARRTPSACALHGCSGPGPPAPPQPATRPIAAGRGGLHGGTRTWPRDRNKSMRGASKNNFDVFGSSGTLTKLQLSRHYKIKPPGGEFMHFAKSSVMYIVLCNRSVGVGKPSRQLGSHSRVGSDSAWLSICPRSSRAVPRDWAHERGVDRDLRSLVEREAVCQYLDAACASGASRFMSRKRTLQGLPRIPTGRKHCA